jgi:hypothetical protein
MPELTTNRARVQQDAARNGDDAREGPFAESQWKGTLY